MCSADFSLLRDTGNAELEVQFEIRNGKIKVSHSLKPDDHGRNHDQRSGGDVGGHVHSSAGKSATLMVCGP